MRASLTGGQASGIRHTISPVKLMHKLDVRAQNEHHQDQASVSKTYTKNLELWRQPKILLSRLTVE